MLIAPGSFSSLSLTKRDPNALKMSEHTESDGSRFSISAISQEKTTGWEDPTWIAKSADISLTFFEPLLSTVARSVLD
jgi:hypothetical protein